MAAAELPTLTGHKHSLDLACKGQFVKLSRNAFEKLQLLYTDHAPTADGDHNHFEVAQGTDSSDSWKGMFRVLNLLLFTVQPPQAGQVAPACAFVNRLFVLLLRYKTIQVWMLVVWVASWPSGRIALILCCCQGHGFQAAAGPEVSCPYLILLTLPCLVASSLFTCCPVRCFACWRRRCAWHWSALHRHSTPTLDAIALHSRM